MARIRSIWAAAPRAAGSEATTIEGPAEEIGRAILAYCDIGITDFIVRGLRSTDAIAALERRSRRWCDAGSRIEAQCRASSQVSSQPGRVWGGGGATGRKVLGATESGVFSSN